MKHFYIVFIFSLFSGSVFSHPQDYSYKYIIDNQNLDSFSLTHNPIYEKENVAYSYLINNNTFQICEILKSKLENIARNRHKKNRTKFNQNSTEFINAEEILTYWYNKELNILNAPIGASVYIFDISGQRVYDLKITNLEEKIRIEKKGVYILNIKHNNINIVRKIIVD